MTEDYKIGLDTWSIADGKDLLDSPAQFLISRNGTQVGTADTLEGARAKLFTLVGNRVRGDIEDARSDIVKWSDLLGRIGDDPDNLGKFRVTAKPARAKSKKADPAPAEEAPKPEDPPVEDEDDSKVWGGPDADENSDEGEVSHPDQTQ